MTISRCSRRMIRWMMLVLCALALAPRGHAATLYVSAAGSNIAPYTNWTTAAHSIAEAVAAAQVNDEVVVTNGTYEVVTTITVSKGVRIRSVNGPAVTTVMSQSGMPASS